MSMLCVHVWANKGGLYSCVKKRCLCIEGSNHLERLYRSLSASSTHAVEIKSLQRVFLLF